MGLGFLFLLMMFTLCGLYPPIPSLGVIIMSRTCFFKASMENYNGDFKESWRRENEWLREEYKERRHNSECLFFKRLIIL